MQSSTNVTSMKSLLFAKLVSEGILCSSLPEINWVSYISFLQVIRIFQIFVTLSLRWRSSSVILISFLQDIYLWLKLSSQLIVDFVQLLRFIELLHSLHCSQIWSRTLIASCFGLKPSSICGGYVFQALVQWKVPEPQHISVEKQHLLFTALKF